MRSFIGSVLRKAGWRQFASIGRYRIELPRRSELLEYRERFKGYDLALGEIARIAAGKYTDLCAIDIGANVGDTAALIRKYGDIPVLCIEGDAAVTSILLRNAVQFGSGIEIETSFVGDDDQCVRRDRITGWGRNASLVNAQDIGGEIRTRSLQSILGDHPRFSSAKLLKTDTEGFDFRIIRSASAWLRSARPLIFLEYNPAFTPDEPFAGIATLGSLVDVGYEHFLYYDNFGNYLTSLRADECDHMGELHAYLGANERHGASVHYFDICAVHRDDADLACSIRQHEMRIPDTALRNPVASP